SGSISAGSSGTYTVTVTVSDGHVTTNQTFTWTVPSMNRAPVVMNPGAVTIAVSEAYAQTVMGDSPSAYWRMDELSGTSAGDRVGTNVGTVQGGVTSGQSGALVNGNPAMLFDGTNGTRVTVPASASLNALNSGTALALETWINPSTVVLPSHYRLFYTFPGD